MFCSLAWCVVAADACPPTRHGGGRKSPKTTHRRDESCAILSAWFFARLGSCTDFRCSPRLVHGPPVQWWALPWPPPSCCGTAAALTTQGLTYSFYNIISAKRGGESLCAALVGVTHTGTGPKTSPCHRDSVPVAGTRSPWGARGAVEPSACRRGRPG